MFFIKLLGVLDLLAAVVLFLLKFKVGLIIGAVLGAYLVIKGVIFFSAASIIDIAAGVLMLLAVYGTYMPLNWLLSLWLLQKAFFSIYG